MDYTTVRTPAPRTRPANRRELIVLAAEKLFAARGYEYVTVSDIAAAVTVGPSALYRHFPGKDEILAASIHNGLESLKTVIDRHAADELLPALAAAAISAPHIAVLWQREAKHLPVALREPLRGEMATLYEQIGRLLPARTHEAGHASTPASSAIEASRIKADAVLSILFSSSFHHLDLAALPLQQLLVEAAARVLNVDINGASPAAVGRQGRSRAARREIVLETAVRLFAERTYASTGLDDIAAAAGLSTSSVYNYFSSKQEILVEALQRGNGYLQLGLTQQLRHSVNADDALAGVISFYARFALQNPEVVSVLVAEPRALPELDAVKFARAQRDFVGEWVSLMTERDPGLDLTAASIQSRAAVMLLNDLARTGHVQRRSDALALMCRLAAAALDLVPGAQWALSPT